MDEAERNCLRRYSKKMSDDIIMTSELLNDMYEGHIFEWGMIEIIKAEKTNSDQVLKMLELLPKRGPLAFDNFIHILENSYPWLATLLESTVQGVSEKGTSLQENNDVTTVKRLYSEPDLDIKKDVGKFVHKHFGQSKRISERDKKAIEKFMIEHMNRVKTTLTCEVKEKEGKETERYNAGIQVDYNCSNLINIHADIKSFLNKKDMKTERYKYFTLESLTHSLEEDVSDLLQKTKNLEERLLRCHEMLAFGDCKKMNKSIESLIQDISSEMRTAENRLLHEKRTTDKLLNEIYTYSDEIHKLEQNKIGHRSQMNLLETQLEKLREENYTLKNKLSKQEMINMQHTEKEKTIENLRRLTQELRASKDKLIMDENNENTMLKSDCNRGNLNARKSLGRFQNRTLNMVNQNMRRNVTKTYTRRKNISNISYTRN